MKSIFENWQTWALLSAFFAALTAIFGKIGVERINPDFATLIRTIVILGVIAAIVWTTQSAQPLETISTKTYVFLSMSGVATGASWLCYYRALKLGPASQVAPVDKLSVVLAVVIAVVFLGEALSLKNWLGVAMIAGGTMLVALKA